MEAHQIVPDIVDTVPPNVTTVTYQDDIQVQLGNELTPAQVKHQPVSLQWNSEPDTLYTLIMSDPDAPARQYPTYREILHWLVVNVSENDVSRGDTILPYGGSGPPQGTGLHRYVFLVFKQIRGPIEVEPLKNRFKQSFGSRAKFNTRNFMVQHNLSSPISGNFFQAQFDQYVQTVRAGRLLTAVNAHQVVPDVIDQPPPFTAEVKYSSGMLMMMGAELTPTQVKDIPDFVIWPHDFLEPDTYYTLCLTDPDAPSREEPKFREFLHWLIVNIPASGQLSSGQTLVEYVGSGPPQGTGLHRYVLLVYRQPDGLISYDEKHVSNRSREGRRSFQIRAFAEKYKLGQPVAGNF